MHQHPSKKALLALVTGAFIIGFSAIFVKLSPVGPTATAFYRLALGLPFLLLLLGKEHTSHVREFQRHPKYTWGLLWPGLFFGIDTWLWHHSIHHTTVANATLLGNLAPIFVTLFAWRFFDEHISKVFILGLLTALLGAILLMGVSFQLRPEGMLGDLLSIGAAIFYSGYQLGIKHFRGQYSTTTLMTATACVGGLFLAVATLLSGESFYWTGPSWVFGLWMLLGLAWLCHLAGQGLIVQGMKRLPASFSSVTLLIQPVVTAVAGWYLLHQHLSAAQIAGGVVVVIGIVLAQRGSKPTEVPKHD